MSKNDFSWNHVADWVWADEVMYVLCPTNSVVPTDYLSRALVAPVIRRGMLNHLVRHLSFLSNGLNAEIFRVIQAQSADDVAVDFVSNDVISDDFSLITVV